MTKTTKKSTKFKDTMRPEYDMSGGIRGKYAGRFTDDVVMVVLEPDLAKVFPDADTVNEALRVLIRVAKTAPSNSRRSVTEETQLSAE